ncbi:hypothetical protein Glove_444g25 [Diversispora epigaea]|uniref:Uncharacterized protein n=1 Tax=Diversispora epigaea TaxID=1348612 RepID=A0A397GU65_9GLOM|nr:hypothetical protein Glove_444g25 [Diversispora epigaea]
MTKRNKAKATLLSCGSLIPNLHYGPFSRDWWYTTTIENKILLVPIRLGMAIFTILNEQKFILHVVQGHLKHSQQPGYCCQAGVLSSNVEESCSAALTSLYQCIFQTKTKFSGPQELGFDDDSIVNQLLDGVLFRPFYISVDKLRIFVYSLGKQDFASSFIYTYCKKKSLFVQIMEEFCKIEIYNETTLVAVFEGDTPTEVWKKTGILQKFDSFELFGLKDDYTKKKLESRELPTCQPTDWTNDNTINSGIMEMWLSLRKIYPENYVFNEREIRTWQAFLKAYEFWTKEINPLHDQETLSTLFENGFLQTTPFVNSSKLCDDFTERLANCLLESYEVNNKGVEGKRRILSIVADKFSLKELKLMKFQMSSRTIQEARTFARINGSGCPIIEKPIIYRTRFSEEAKNQFEKFFSDKSIVNMSSYKVDPKTKLPMLYLKDNKTALWEKFLEIYPDGFKRTTFMTELAQERFQYREDLGGLCSICCQYGYDVFEDLVELISAQIKDLKYQSILIDKVEKVRRHMKRDYEKEISINTNGQVNHDSCISHCLAYAFGICENIHTSICEKCNELWILFEQLQSDLDESHSEMLNEALYLNSQFSASLRELDEDGVLIVIDYKMRVLPKSARETKDEFFGKRRWTLHTVLMYTKKDNKLDICAFDHWSNDTRQDVWFTALSLYSTIITLEKKPKWISIISDNGGHYHNSELMVILSYWYEWYNVEVKKWIFLEPGEAKTTIDSHHAQIAHAIKHFVRLGNDLTSGEKIETAIENLCGTSVAHLEPNRNTGNQVKTLTGISKWYFWKWLCEGTYSGYIRARTLPNVGKWISFSLAQINCLVKQKINKPELACTLYSIPKTLWNIPIPDPSKLYPLPKGWTIKGEQKYGKKGGGTRITKEVVKLLKGFFHAGNANSSQRYLLEDMFRALNEKTDNNELERTKIPKIEMIRNWISRYSTAMKKETAERMLASFTLRLTWPKLDFGVKKSEVKSTFAL